MHLFILGISSIKILATVQSFCQEMIESKCKEFLTLVKQTIVVLLMFYVNTIGGFVLFLNKIKNTHTHFIQQ